jgi:hypothetical protein
MEKIVIHGEVTPDGELRIELPKDLPVGRLKITLESDEPESFKGITLGELVNSELNGLWADRTDIEDSVEFSRQQKRRMFTRGGKHAE